MSDSNRTSVGQIVSLTIGLKEEKERLKDVGKVNFFAELII